MKHGGNIKEAAQRFGIEPAEIIDLSTGISPRAYPLSLEAITPEELIDLPQLDDDQKLQNVMRQAWTVPDSADIALSPGSGLIINLLPQLCQRHYADGRTVVLCPEPVYSEHENAWRAAGFDIEYYNAADIPVLNDRVAAVVIVQPGNPLGNIRPKEDWHPFFEEAVQKKVFITVDEAFIDLTPQHSLVSFLKNDGQIVIRSLGKFYGLAGVRLGAAIGQSGDMECLRQFMGPWATSTLALRFGAEAIADQDWAHHQREWLSKHMSLMRSGLEERGFDIVGSTDLYCLIRLNNAQGFQSHLAKAGFWTRIFDYEPSWMRLGLPANTDILARFFTALDTYSANK